MSATAVPMTRCRSSMLAECFAIFDKMIGEIVGVRLHQPLSAASTICVNTFLFCAATAPAGVLTTGCGAGGSTCGVIHNCWTGAASVPNVVSSRCFSHPMVTGSVVSTAVGLSMLHSGDPICTILALRHHSTHISIPVCIPLFPVLAIVAMIFLCSSHGVRYMVSIHSTSPVGIISNIGVSASTCVPPPLICTLTPCWLYRWRT